MNRKISQHKETSVCPPPHGLGIPRLYFLKYVTATKSKTDLEANIYDTIKS